MAARPAKLLYEYTEDDVVGRALKSFDASIEIKWVGSVINETEKKNTPRWEFDSVWYIYSSQNKSKLLSNHTPLADTPFVNGSPPPKRQRPPESGPVKVPSEHRVHLPDVLLPFHQQPSRHLCYHQTVYIPSSRPFNIRSVALRDEAVPGSLHH